MPYRIPIFLWSTVVNQLQKPVVAIGRRRIPRCGRDASRLPSFASAPTTGCTGRRRGASICCLRSGRSRASSRPCFTAFGSSKPRLQRLDVRRARRRTSRSRSRRSTRASGRAKCGQVRRRRAPGAWCRRSRGTRCTARPRRSSRGTESIPWAASARSAGVCAGCLWLGRPTPASRPGPSATMRNFIIAVLQAAELRALAEVRARLVRGEHDVVVLARCARHDVLLAEQPRRPERVDHLVVGVAAAVVRRRRRRAATG